MPCVHNNVLFIHRNASISVSLIILTERALSDGVDVIVGTPGRIQDHIDRGSLSLADIQYVLYCMILCDIVWYCMVLHDMVF